MMNTNNKTKYNKIETHVNTIKLQLKTYIEGRNLQNLYVKNSCVL